MFTNIIINSNEISNITKYWDILLFVTSVWLLITFILILYDIGNSYEDHYKKLKKINVPYPYKILNYHERS